MLLVQEMEAVQREVVAQADARAEKAESEAAAEKEQRKRIMEAAANGALPLAASSPRWGHLQGGNACKCTNSTPSDCERAEMRSSVVTVHTIWVLAGCCAHRKTCRHS